jgi:hypothetical protein
MRSVRWIVATIVSLMGWLPGQSSWAQQADPAINQTASQAANQATNQAAMQATTQAATQVAIQATAQAGVQSGLLPPAQGSPQAPSQNTSPLASSGQSTDDGASAERASPLATSAPVGPRTTGSGAPDCAADTTAALGTVVSPSQLDTYRGGSETFNDMQVNGTLENTRATNVYTGNNSVTDGSFSNASGLPTVIQNSGANVLIQNATILNVQFKQ